MSCNSSFLPLLFPYIVCILLLPIGPLQLSFFLLKHFFLRFFPSIHQSTIHYAAYFLAPNLSHPLFPRHQYPVPFAPLASFSVDCLVQFKWYDRKDIFLLTLPLSHTIRVYSHRYYRRYVCNHVFKRWTFRASHTPLSFSLHFASSHFILEYLYKHPHERIAYHPPHTANLSNGLLCWRRQGIRNCIVSHLIDPHSASFFPTPFCTRHFSFSSDCIHSSCFALYHFISSICLSRRLVWCVVDGCDGDRLTVPTLPTTVRRERERERERERGVIKRDKLAYSRAMTYYYRNIN